MKFILINKMKYIISYTKCYLLCNVIIKNLKLKLF
jgi:hypothetical protein